MDWYISPSLIAGEATGGYELSLVHFLCQTGIRVATVPSKCVLDFARAHNPKVKNDTLDANNTAHFAAVMQPRMFMPPSPAQEKLMTLVTRRR